MVRFERFAAVWMARSSSGVTVVWITGLRSTKIIISHDKISLDTTHGYANLIM